MKDLEDVSKPLVAAIDGHALGGGLEFAMACHYRVAVAGAKVGQPEVTLGIIPGAGGTQRLPRLSPLKTALELCSEGKFITASRAQAEGIIDEIVSGDLLDGAMTFALARAKLGERRKTRELPLRMTNRDEGRAACAGGASDAGENRSRCARPSGERRRHRGGRDDGLRRGLGA